MPCKGKFCTRILTKNFSLGGFYSSTAIFLYAEMGKIRITEKETFDFDERFFVRQFKALEGYILICRESFKLYHGKRSVKNQ